MTCSDSLVWSVAHWESLFSAGCTHPRCVPPGCMDTDLHPKPLPAIPDTAVCCFTCTWQQLPRKHGKDYFYTTSRCQQPTALWVQALAHAESLWLGPTNLSPSWAQEWDLLGCHLGLAITQPWQGEMLSSCKEMAEKDVPTLMLG